MVLLRNQDDSKKDTLGDIVSSGGMPGCRLAAIFSETFRLPELRFRSDSKLPFGSRRRRGYSLPGKGKTERGPFADFRFHNGDLAMEEGSSSGSWQVVALDFHLLYKNSHGGDFAFMEFWLQAVSRFSCTATYIA